MQIKYVLIYYRESSDEGDCHKLKVGTPKIDESVLTLIRKKSRNRVTSRAEQADEKEINGNRKRRTPRTGNFPWVSRDFN